MAERWPSEHPFCVHNAAALAKIRIPAGCWLGVYAYDSGQPRLVCTGKSPANISRRVAKLQLAWPLWVVRAKKRVKLPTALGRGEENHYRRLRTHAFQAIAIARNRDDKAFLRELIKAARATGKGAGDKATAEENRRMVDVLKRLSAGATVKQIAIDQRGAGGFEKRERSLSVLLDRFCKRVVQALRQTFGPHSTGWKVAHLRYALRDWPGISFPDDACTLLYAAKRGACQNK